MEVSVVMTSYKRAELLDYGLQSMSWYKKKYETEIIVLNDGIEDETENVCKKYSDQLDVKYVFTGQRNKEKEIWRIPGYALNIGVKMSKGDIIIITCPEICHINDAINLLVEPLLLDKMLLTIPIGKDDNHGNYLAGIKALEWNRITDTRPSFKSLPDLRVELPFFMGLSREAFIDIGGYDEDFTGISYDDDDFVERMLLRGCKYKKTEAKVVHLYHPRPHAQFSNEPKFKSRLDYNQKLYEDRKGIIVRNIGKE